MLTLTPDGNFYEQNGIRYDRITRVLQEEGYCPDYSAHIDPAYAVRGNHLHTLTELEDKDELDEATLYDGYRPFLQCYRSFKKDTGAQMLMAEQRVHNDELGIAGTLDRINLMAGKRWLMDYKFYASSADVVWHHLQTAMYALCLQWPTNIPRSAVILNPLFRFGYKIHVHGDIHDIAVARSIIVCRRYRQQNKMTPAFNDFSDPEICFK
jgi:hypothetical protein